MKKLMLAAVAALALSVAAQGYVSVVTPAQAGCPKHNPNC